DHTCGQRKAGRERLGAQVFAHAVTLAGPTGKAKGSAVTEGILCRAARDAGWIFIDLFCLKGRASTGRMERKF
ncbi:MAG TPA: hypothetical protein VMC06_00535, partial [Opitutaceae bacterium]|nr:hypothetical protein [Opitutaceae bacterium]